MMKMAACLPNQMESPHLACNEDADLSDSESSFEDFGNGQSPENFEFSGNTTCWICNGYYGPNYNEPLCGTCHAFLFPISDEQLVTKICDDDEDSGNDEPPFTFVGQEPEQILPVQQFQNSSDDDESGDENQNLFELRRAVPNRPRDLPYFLELLEVGQQRYQPSVNQKKITELPPEVLMQIFSYLDDISLWNISKVCAQFRQIVEMNTSQTLWKRFLKERWPLFRSLVEVQCWFKLYSALISSSFCQMCLQQIAFHCSEPLRDNAIRTNRLRFEFRSLNLIQSEGIQAIPLDRQNLNWQASILGPPGSPYEGGKFFLKIFIPETYPMFPPKIRFLTKILHPNVSRHGDVGIDILNRNNWSIALTVSKVLLSLQSLLTDPFTEVCMEPELGYIYENNRKRFENLARTWTWKYAMFEALHEVEENLGGKATFSQ